MSQHTIINFLKQNEHNWYSTKQISKMINVCASAVQVNLKKMRKWELVEYRKMKIGPKHWMEYRHKR